MPSLYTFLKYIYVQVLVVPLAMQLKSSLLSLMMMIFIVVAAVLNVSITCFPQLFVSL